jgi:hypothetical protein
MRETELLRDSGSKARGFTFTTSNVVGIQSERNNEHGFTARIRQEFYTTLPGSGVVVGDQHEQRDSRVAGTLHPGPYTVTNNRYCHLPCRCCHLSYRYCHLWFIFHTDTVISPTCGQDDQITSCHYGALHISVTVCSQCTRLSVHTLLVRDKTAVHSQVTGRIS